jgi:hypothetical protein
MQTQVVRRFLGKQAERRAREILFQPSTFYSHTHLLYTDGWILAGGLSHHHHRYQYHPTQGSDAIPEGALEAGIGVLHVSVSSIPTAVQDNVSVGSAAW